MRLLIDNGSEGKVSHIIHRRNRLHTPAIHHRLSHNFYSDSLERNQSPPIKYYEQ